jgi:AraC-like DNA-binding protein
MIYHTFAPQQHLLSFIKCFWTLDAAAGPELTRQRIVPDGCMEMIFHHGDLYRQYISNDHFIIQPRSFVFGQILQPLEIEPTGRTGIFAARFQPNGFVPFSSLPLSEMENRAVPLEELFGSQGPKLEQAVLAASNSEDRISILESFFLQKLSDPLSIDRITRSCVETILELKGQLSVKELSDRLNINRRQLERKFSSVIGISPKQLSKIIRLQSALKLMADQQVTSLTSLAHDGDYYDQAHFIKDFKEFTGMSPKQFYADSLKMSALFSASE